MDYIFEMAQRQGQDSDFVYYTLDNEPASHYPHIHICVKSDDKHWSGKNFKNGQNLKTIAAVRLSTKPYTESNVTFEIVVDSKITGIQYRRKIANWLNSRATSYTGRALGLTKSDKALNDYFESNSNCLHKQKYINGDI